MFDTADGPLATMANLYDWIVDHAALMAPEVRAKFKKLNREEVQVQAQIEGMEYLYRACKEDDLLPGREEALTILGTLAMHTYSTNLWGKGARAYEIAGWAASQLDPNTGASEGPDFDPAYVFVEPEPAPAPAPPPVPMPAPAEPSSPS